MKTLILDIETIPDYDAAARAGVTDTTTFLPWPLHALACVSILSITHQAWEEPQFDIVTYSRETASERAIIAEVERQLEAADEVVTFNGRGFDVPVLMARAALVGEYVPRLVRMQSRAHPTFHNDLLDEVTGFGSAPKVKLAHLCATYGIPVKIDASGDEVRNMAEAGEWLRISNYCESDVVATWLARQMWRSSQQPGLGTEGWSALANWLSADQPRLAHLLPYALVRSDLGGHPLGSSSSMVVHL